MGVPSLPLRTRLLPRAGDGERLLVLLHGYGLPPSDLTDRLDLLDPHHRCTVAVPTAPFERRGAAIWHRALSNSAEVAAQQYQEALHLLDELLGALEELTGLAAADAVVGGFSQGGGLGYGLLVGADLEHRPAAAFGICSFPPAFRGFRVDPGAAAGRRCFLASAHRDHFAPIEGSRAGACRLRDAGLDLTYVELDTEHEMTDEAAAVTGRWLDAVAAGAPVTGFDDVLEQVGTGAGFYDELWVETSSSPD